MKRLITQILFVSFILSVSSISYLMADAGPAEVLRGYDLKKTAADALQKASTSLARTAEVVSDKDQVEKIKKFTLLPKEFTQEDGEITATQKIKRKVINQRYRDIIDAMYAE